MAKIPQTNEEIKEYVEDLFKVHVEKGNKEIQNLIDRYINYGYTITSDDGKKIVLKMYDAPDVTVEKNKRYFDMQYLFDNQGEKPFILHDPELTPNGGVEEKYYL